MTKKILLSQPLYLVLSFAFFLLGDYAFNYLSDPKGTFDPASFLKLIKTSAVYLYGPLSILSFWLHKGIENVFGKLIFTVVILILTGGGLYLGYLGLVFSCFDVCPKNISLMILSLLGAGILLLVSTVISLIKLYAN